MNRPGPRVQLIACSGVNAGNLGIPLKGTVISRNRAKQLIAVKSVSI